MEAIDVFDLAQQSIITLLWVSGPIMAIALAVGLIIALFQALTSIQEVTLTFVPKILLVFLSMIFLMPLMADKMNIFAQEIFTKISEK
ncbi:MAG: flagellar biosynthesis protein FliQ [Alphaproteobacteria bacterium]|nr:flagellar biosynthesis protein FliQ [Alphaproteobacteria bacterium]